MKIDNKERISKLSPAQRKLFEQRIKGENIAPQKKITIPPRSNVETYPLTIEQEQLWFTYTLDANAAYQHLALSCLFSGDFKFEALERAVNEIIRRHESLRTTFPSKDGVPFVMVSPSLTLKINVIDLPQMSESDREATSLRIFSDLVNKRFDLAKGPLLRVTLIPLSVREHTLQVITHHIVSDKLSSHMFWHELAILYDSFSKDRHSPLPELPIQYGDYAVWLQDWYKSQEMREYLNYWKEKLADPPILSLNTDYHRPTIYTYSGERHHYDGVSTELWEGVKALSLSQNVSRFMTLLAVYSMLLYIYTKQDDIIIGSPVNNREHEETQELLGYFLNMLGFRINLSGNPTFLELMGRVRNVCLEAFAHQKLSSVKVLQELRLKRDPSRPPLYQVGYIYTNETEDPAAQKLSVTISPFGSSSYESSLDDLTFMAMDFEDSVTLAIEYNTDLFERSTIDRMLSHYKTLLEVIVGGYKGTIEDIPLIDEAERRQLLEEWNNTAREYRQDKCVHELFEEQVEKSPDAVVLVYEDHQLSYKELNERANELAHHLHSFGVEPEQRIAICLERSIELIVAELSIIKCGATYVPLDINAPQARLEYMMADCQAAILLTITGIEIPVDTRANRINIDTLILTNEASNNLAISHNGDLAAYVMYTSGSTGQPKGVVVPHRAIIKLVLNNGYADFDNDDCVAFSSNPSFDASTMELWAPMLNGGKVVVVAQNCLLNPISFGQSLQEQRVTVIWLTAGLFHQYVSQIAEAFGGLRYLMSGGDVLEPGSIARLLGNNAPQHLLNGYGPTETTTFATTYEIRKEIEINKSIPIGRPISNTSIYVLGEMQELKGVGICGELYVGGAGVSRGYLGRPEMTAENFLPNSYSQQAGARVYRTGDLGRWLSSGEIEFLGRNDYQVKIRGHRIELGEIESRLSEHEDVKSVVVVARDDGGGGKRLIAYYSCDSGAEIEAGQLRSHLSPNLPEYMLPAAYVQLEAMPLTPNGKLDRRALPDPEDEAYARPGYEEPQGEIETILAGIWSELLGVERVGRWDDFFTLGGHSLLAISLIERMYNVGLHTNALTLFVSPTLSGFASSVSNVNDTVQVPPTKIPNLSKKLSI